MPRDSPVNCALSFVLCKQVMPYHLFKKKKDDMPFSTFVNMERLKAEEETDTNIFTNVLSAIVM